MNKFSTALLFLASLFSVSCFAKDADGYCVNGRGSDHSPYTYSFNFDTPISYTFNVAGTEVKDAVSQSSGENYPGVCICTSSLNDTFMGLYYTAQLASGLSVTRKIGDLNYFSLPGTRNLEAAVSLPIYGRGYQSVPFEYIKNGNTQVTSCSDNNGSVHENFNTGSSVNISFYIARPFVGEVVIPQMDITRIYGTLSRSSPLYQQPLVVVRLGGRVTVPQNCEVNSGQVINVDFGKVEAFDFPSSPGGVTNRTITKQVQVKCAQMVAGQGIKGELQADAAAGNTRLIATSNPDVGIEIKDKNGRVVDVNRGELPIEVATANTQGEIDGMLTFSSTPASVSGARPKPGAFTATATVVVEFSH